ncbi:MAG TPA: hypothetical protein VG370_11110 [Chloroflexota bacterium]|nr:hypothetical protein [Chloroflexota bacterium]
MIAQERAPAGSWAELAGRALVRTLLFALAGATLLIAPASPRRDVPTGLAETTRRQAFSVVGWEVAALSEKALAVARPIEPDPERRVQIVQEHFRNVAEIRRLRAERDRLFASGRGAEAPLADVERELAERQRRFDRSRGEVEAIVALQIDAVLREERLRGELVAFVPSGGWPIPFLRVDPEVFFMYQRLPLNLVIAPRDRIGIVGSVLVSPDLTAAEIDALEGRVDGIGVSSLVSGIGGFGSYPSMIPDTESLPRGLDVIAHEWVHHYLAFRPLGRAFFASYEMRSVNETVADIIGQEIGARAFERFYRASEPAPSRPAPAAGPRRDFGAEMRRIRREVERLLAAGDVPAAERYMAEQREELVRLGWQVRKLNTAYLSFFGAYSGGANRFEAPLRALRARSGSLAAFLGAVERFERPDGLMVDPSGP